MTVAEPLQNMKLSDAPTAIPAYSTIEIRDVLLATGRPNSMTFGKALTNRPGMVLKFQLPAEPADVRLLKFATTKLNVVDVPFSIPQD